MAIIDPSRNTLPLIARPKVEDDPVGRRNLLDTIDHSRAEPALNVSIDLGSPPANPFVIR